MEDKLVVSLTAEIKGLTDKLKEAQEKLLNFGNDVETALKPITLNILEKQLEALNNELKNTEIGSVRFKELGAEITAVEGKITGAFQKISTVGVRGFNGLNNSINQITRELPAFGLSANIGFLAISNNLPILIDEINRLKVANQQLAAQGQPVQSIFKQITSALVSYQTALSLGVVLLTLYGSKLVDFISDLSTGNSTIDETKSKIEALNTAYQSGAVTNAIADYIKLVGALDQVKKGVVTQDEFLKKYNTTVQDLGKTATSFKEAEKAIIDQTDEYVNAVIAREAANVIAKDAANTLIELNKAKAKSESEYLTTAMAASATQFKDVKDGAATLKAVREQEVADRKRLAKEAKDAEIKTLEENYNKQLQLLKGFQTSFKAVSSETGNGKAKTPDLTKPILGGDAMERMPTMFDTVNEKVLELKGNFESLNISAKKPFTDPEMENYISNINNIVNILGGALTSAFDAALISGQNFGQVLVKAIGDVIKKLLAAVATAAILSVILNAFTAGGAAAVGGFSGILKGLTGFNFGRPAGATTSTQGIIPTPANDGTVSFEIRGDKLYGVLQNYQGRLKGIS